MPGERDMHYEAWPPAGSVPVGEGATAAASASAASASAASASAASAYAALPVAPTPGRRRCCGGFCYQVGHIVGQARQAMSAPFRNAAALSDAPAELWVCIWMQSLISLNYFALALILTPYLSSSSFGLSDQRAGLAYGLFGTLTSLFAFPAGLLCDYAGIRWSLFMAGILNVVGRLVLALTSSAATAQAVLFTLLPVANAIDFGVCATSVRRFTPVASRTIAFALLSTFLSLGQLLAGIARDAFVLTAEQDGAVRLRDSDGFHVHVTGERALLLFGAALATIELGLSGFAAGKGAVSEHSGLPSARTTLRQKLRVPPRALVAATLKDPSFWRFSLLLVLCSIVRMLLQYVTAAMPKFVTRLFGEGVPVGSLLSIPPLLCIFLVPLLTATTLRVPVLTMITAGALVSSLSLLWLVSSVSLWAVLVFLVTLAVGDAMWSPRLFEYAAAVSPPAASSTWCALGALPLFAAKLPAGLLSGVLLDEFVPAQGHRRPRAMWAIVGSITFVAPCALFLLRRVIQGGGAAETVAAAAAASGAAAAPCAASWGSSAEPVELAEAYLVGEFELDAEEGEQGVQLTTAGSGTGQGDNPFR